MKLDARAAERFLRDPGAVRIVLLHGADEGLLRHRAEQVTRAIVGAKDDPFRVAWLSREDHDRLIEEYTALSMTTGRRVVRVRDVVDGLAPVLKRVLETAGDTVIVLESGVLPSRSKLRLLCEAASGAAVIACYPEEPGSIQHVVEQALRGAGIELDEDAKTWAGIHLGIDRSASRGEIEKLILYAEPAVRLTLADVQNCIGEQAALSIDDAVFSCTSGDVVAADRSVDVALENGTSAVAVCRMMLAHLLRLEAGAIMMSAGSSASDVARQLRPPIFFARVGQFSASLRLWHREQIRGALDAVRRVEMLCKQTNAPDALLVRRLISGIAQQSAARVRSGRG